MSTITLEKSLPLQFNIEYHLSGSLAIQLLCHTQENPLHRYHRGCSQRYCLQQQQPENNPIAHWKRDKHNVLPSHDKTYCSEMNLQCHATNQMNLHYTLSEILNLKGLQEALHTLLKAKVDILLQEWLYRGNENSKKMNTVQKQDWQDQIKGVRHAVGYWPRSQPYVLHGRLTDAYSIIKGS